MNRFTTTLALMATIILTLSSCERVIIANTENQTPDDAETSSYHFRLLAPSTTRATSAADFRAIYAVDVVNGAIVQYIEQKSTDDDFGTISLDLTRGSHSLRFFATESDAATYSAGTVIMPSIQDCFYRSITFDASTSLGTTDVVLTRLVAKVINNSEADITLMGLYPNYNMLAESPTGDVSDLTLHNGESAFVLPPSAGYVTTSTDKHIPVSSNKVTVINKQGTTTPTESEVLIMTNDTAAFYLSSREIKGIALSSMSDALATLNAQVAPYRVPTRLEARAISSFVPSDEYWSGERLICYDDPKDESVNESYGTGEFYTFKFNSTTIPVKANPASSYSLKPIRTAPLAPLNCPFRIDFNFDWEADSTKVE